MAEKEHELKIEPTLCELPPIGCVVSARCQRSDGSVDNYNIRRIKTKDTDKGWQWSHPEINTYFTLEVLSWRLI